MFVFNNFSTTKPISDHNLPFDRVRQDLKLCIGGNPSIYQYFNLRCIHWGYPRPKTNDLLNFNDSNHKSDFLDLNMLDCAGLKIKLLTTIGINECLYPYAEMPDL